MKLAILGYSGSGKSTLGKWLGMRYQIPILYLDKVQFLPNWEERPRSEAATMVAEFMERPSWVIDGNYVSFLQAERLEQADGIIYMNFPRATCLVRAFKRYRSHRNTSRESITSGCIEKMDLEFAWWILYAGRTWEKRRHYQAVVEKYREKTVVLKNQKQLDQFLSAPEDYLICTKQTTP